MEKKNPNKTCAPYSSSRTPAIVFLLLIIGVSALWAANNPPTPPAPDPVIGNGFDKFNEGIESMCGSLLALLPVASMLGVVSSGGIYALGQLMGAETRARAVVWATTMLTGSVIAVLITAVAPPAVGMIYGGTDTCEPSIIIGNPTQHLCGTIEYNPNTQGCCGTQIYSKDSYKCCRPVSDSVCLKTESCAVGGCIGQGSSQ
ncbi:hypothetical protein FJZ26_02485 [Candidatus Parvarchaeota archaeon]|nr:hypothetical protein [Candidatus Parvarchaeota archaeon]